jgi:hypothetical protein
MLNAENRRDFTGLKHHARVHTFRIATAVLAWAAIIAAFYYRPDWIKWGLRTGTHGIEALGDSMPYPWGDRIEIVLRELGGLIWFQITIVIIAIRVFLFTITLVWRTLRQNRGIRW